MRERDEKMKAMNKPQRLSQQTHNIVTSVWQLIKILNISDHPRKMITAKNEKGGRGEGRSENDERRK